MPKPLPADTDQFIEFSPYFALLEGKTEQQTEQFDAKYDALPEAIRQFLLSPEASETLAKLHSERLVPASHIAAVSKLFGMVIMNDVKSDQVVALLSKLGLATEAAAIIQQRFLSALTPLLSVRAAQTAAPPTMKPLPPLTQRIGAPATATPGPQAPARNIIDLRTTQNS